MWCTPAKTRHTAEIYEKMATLTEGHLKLNSEVLVPEMVLGAQI